MAARNSFDNAVETQPAQVVRHPTEGIVNWVKAQQLRDQGAHLQIREPSELKTEHYENSQQSLDAGITEAKGGGSLPFDFDGANYLFEGIFANRTIMRDFLDVQQTPVGLKADLPQCGQVLQRLADAEVARVIDGGFRTESLALLVILLDACVLVVNVQGWHDSIGDHPRPEAARGPFVDAASK